MNGSIDNKYATYTHEKRNASVIHSFIYKKRERERSKESDVTLVDTVHF